MPMKTLEIGKRALLSQRYGLDVTSNNIGNVNTEGYSRRTASISETDPLLRSGIYFGTGALPGQLRTYRDEFFDKEIRNTIARKSSYESDEIIYKKIESILSEPSEGGIGEIVTDFFKAFDELSLKPESIAHRQNVVHIGKTMVERFQRVDAQLADMRTDLNNTAFTLIDKANGLIKNIASLNDKIASSKNVVGNEVQTLVDRRELALEELSEIIDISVSHGEKGANVFVNGINLATGKVYGSIRIQEDIDTRTGERSLILVKQEADGAIRNRLSPNGGEIKSLLDHYNYTFDGSETSNRFSLSKELNEYANAIVQNVNDLMVTGYGLNDTTSPAPGRNFFEPLTGNATAATIEVAKDILDNPRNMPLSSAPGESGNSEIARSIARILDSSSFLNGQSPTEYYSGILTKIGNLGKDAEHGASTTNMLEEQLQNQRESVIGVNLDEEAINLVKFQKAFEASARILSMTDEILATIVNLGR